MENQKAYELLKARIKVHPDTGCWQCTFGGTMTYGAVKLDNGRMQAAHRFLWERENGAIPDGLIACHKCDNPRCCNPAHIFIGTHGENTYDCILKGRLNNGRMTILPRWEDYGRQTICNR